MTSVARLECIHVNKPHQLSFIRTAQHLSLLEAFFVALHHNDLLSPAAFGNQHLLTNTKARTIIKPAGGDAALPALSPRAKYNHR